MKCQEKSSIVRWWTGAVACPVLMGDSRGVSCRCISASGLEDLLKSFKGKMPVRAPEEVKALVFGVPALMGMVGCHCD
jgi:hypothetical protein